jgi:hypothetical protein
MNKTWHYLTKEDYEEMIKPLPLHSKLKYQLLSQYKNKIPLLFVSYIKLKKKLCQI